MHFFTPQERFAILFLIFILVLGTSIYLYKLNHPSFAPAYIIKDFEKKMKEERMKQNPVNYNLPLPYQEKNEMEIKKKELQKGQININTARIEVLIQIPGIGPAYAKKIIEYRTKYNGFKTIEEIKRIKGVGDKTFEKMKGYIKVK